ncbi:MAG: DUF1800 family protein, partial [Verrucomicrobiota bacterium]
REPLIRMMHVCRAMNLLSWRTDGVFHITKIQEDINQYPYESPSVFNFYLPDHQPNGMIRERGLYAPVLQIVDDVTAVKTANVFLELSRYGLRNNISGGGNNVRGGLNLNYEISLATNVDTLLEHLDLVLTAGRLTEVSRTAIRTAVLALPVSDAEGRARRAIALITTTPEFAILQ